MPEEVEAPMIRYRFGPWDPRYRQFLPRMWRHLNANLEQPALAPVARWFDRHVPTEVRA